MMADTAGPADGAARAADDEPVLPGPPYGRTSTDPQGIRPLAPIATPRRGVAQLRREWRPAHVKY